MTVFAWVGLIIVGVAALGSTFAAVVHAAVTLRDRKERRAMSAAISLIANDIISTSWWFSEHEPTMKLLQEYGAELHRLGRSNASPDDMRGAWRKRMGSTQP